MSYTRNPAVRFCAAIAVLASLGVSVSHARSPVRAAYGVRVLPLEFPFVTGFNERQQVIGYGPRPLTSVGFVWDARRRIQFISSLGSSGENSTSAIPMD